MTKPKTDDGYYACEEEIVFGRNKKEKCGKDEISDEEQQYDKVNNVDKKEEKKTGKDDHRDDEKI